VTDPVVAVPAAVLQLGEQIREFHDHAELVDRATNRLGEDAVQTAEAATIASEFSPVTIHIQTEDGRPLEGYRVEMSSTEGRRVFASGESNASGLALSRNMHYGDYRLRITEPSGWTTNFNKITVEVGAPLRKVVKAPDPDERVTLNIESHVEKQPFRGLTFHPHQHRVGPALPPLEQTDFPKVGDGIEEVAFKEKGLNPNVDFYAASVYHVLGIPTDLMTPIFAIARMAGWTAHVREQYADNRLIRPESEYIGPRDQTYVPIEDRP
jgi:hypothetical protein